MHRQKLEALIVSTPEPPVTVARARISGLGAQRRHAVGALAVLQHYRNVFVEISVNKYGCSITESNRVRISTTINRISCGELVQQ